MSHEVHIPHEEPPKKKEEDMDEPFGKWAFGQVPFLITQAASLLLALGTFIYYVFHSEQTLTELFDITQAEHIMYYLNLVFCIFCVIKLITIFPDNSFGEFTARKLYKRIFQTTLTLGQHRQRRRQSMYLLSRFKLYFLFFWIVMVALYSSFTINTFNHIDQEFEGKLIKEEKSIKSTFFIQQEDEKKIDSTTKTNEERSIVEYGKPQEMNLIKNNKTDTAINTTEIKPIKSTLEVFSKEWGQMLVYSFNTISIMFIFWCFSILAIRAQKPTNYKNKITLVYLSLFFTISFVAMYPSCISLASHIDASNNRIYYPENLTNYTVLFDALSGVINAVFLALFIARLDSKLLSMPSGLISVLYIYAAIQPLFVVFDLPGFVNETIKVMVLFLVFFLKIYFFFIITYAIQKGKIFAYLYCFTTLNNRVESIVSNHYRIKIIKEENNHLSFTYAIYISDFILFQGQCSCSSEETCISNIEDMQLLAKRRENYHFEYIAENWYIHLKDKSKKLLCSSYLSLTSDSEGEEIIEESIKKIPYCDIVLLRSH